VLNGYNGTYFVYGQTGTGKTYTMGVLDSIDVNSRGIIPQSVDTIINSLHSLRASGSVIEWKVHVSFYQIYQDHIQDLLNPNEGKNLSIREENDGEIFVEHLVEVPIENVEQAVNIINAGMKYREIASQKMNDTSSRSHTILHIDVYQNRHYQQDPNQVE
jgi:kinesin family protein 5